MGSFQGPQDSPNRRYRSVGKHTGSPDNENAGSDTAGNAFSSITGKDVCCLLVTDAQHDFCEGSLAAPRGVQVAERLGKTLDQLRRHDPRSYRGSEHAVGTEECAGDCGATHGSCEELASRAAVENISRVSGDPESSGHGDLRDPWCDMVVFSLDWHPSDHVSFVTSHATDCMHSICSCAGTSLSPAAREAACAEVEEAMACLGTDKHWTVVPNSSGSEAPGASLVRLWPPHCVQNTPGANLYRSITPRIGDFVVRKGISSAAECFSACGNADEQTGLVPLLRSKGVKTVAVCGFCLDFCVAVSAVGLRAAGFRDVVVLTDLTAAVNESKQQEAIDYLLAHRVRCLTLEEFIEERSKVSFDKSFATNTGLI